MSLYEFGALLERLTPEHLSRLSSACYFLGNNKLKRRGFLPIAYIKKVSRVMYLKWIYHFLPNHSFYFSTDSCYF